jgi:putative acetyltransferase
VEFAADSFGTDMVAVRHARFPEDQAAVLEIWHEYVSSPSVSLDYQGNDEEFAQLPGKYSAPGGCILLGLVNERVEGCIAMRRVDHVICEMKKLYVRPTARGHGMARMLVAHLIAQARDVGYLDMRLDVLAEFTAAQRLYESFGFTPAPAVSFNPNPGTKFLGFRLA